jgi:hypothetical protein
MTVPVAALIESQSFLVKEANLVLYPTRFQETESPVVALRTVRLLGTACIQTAKDGNLTNLPGQAGHIRVPRSPAFP